MAEDIRQVFAKNFARLKRERGFTQTYLAKSLGVTRFTITAWEEGKSWPTAANVMAVAALFEVEPPSLFQAEAGESQVLDRKSAEEILDQRFADQLTKIDATIERELRAQIDKLSKLLEAPDPDKP